MLPKQLRNMGLAVGLAMLVATPVNAATSMLGIIDGDTFDNPFNFTNLSNDGETIDSLTLDLSGAGALCFDVGGGGVCNGSIGVPFTPQNGSDVTTGSSAPTIGNAETTLDLTFTNFDPFETLSFIIDVDVLNGAAVTFGNDLIGATISAMFSDGSSLLAIFAGVEGNSDAAALILGDPVPPIPVPAGLPLLLTALGGLGFLARRRERT